MAEREKLNDENRRLCDVRPLGAVLIITECRGEKDDHTVDFSIGHLIGKRNISILIGTSFLLILCCF